MFAGRLSPARGLTNRMTQTLYAAYAEKIDAVLSALEAEAVLPPETNRANVSVEPPRDPAHGDLATNAAMVLAKQAKSNPRALAEKIVEHLERDPAITSAEELLEFARRDTDGRRFRPKRQEAVDFLRGKGR